MGQGLWASNPPLVFCIDQLHCKDAHGDAVGWGRESEPRGRPSDPGRSLALPMGASWLAGMMPWSSHSTVRVILAEGRET